MPWSASVTRTECEDECAHLGCYHAGFSEQVLVRYLGGAHLPWKLRAGHELGLGAWGRPLLELLLGLRTRGTAEAQGYGRLLQKHLEAEQEGL